MIKMRKLLFLIPLFAIACSSSKEVEFEKSTGKINTVEAGSRFHINLSEDHKVGSGLWSMGNKHDPKIVGYINSSFKSDDGGSVDFNFEALAKGKTEIQLCQSFAMDIIQKVVFVVEVK